MIRPSGYRRLQDAQMEDRSEDVRGEPAGAEQPPASEPEPEPLSHRAATQAPATPRDTDPPLSLQRLASSLLNMFSPHSRKTVERQRTVEMTTESQRMMSLSSDDDRYRSSSLDVESCEEEPPPPRPCAFSKTRVIIGLVALSIFLVIVTAVVTTQMSTHRHQAHYLWDASARVIDGKYVETMASCGLVRGRVVEDGFVFIGVPYALSPVGRRRFQAAESPRSLSSCWRGTLSAEQTSPNRCPHLADDGSAAGDEEDCLKVDIYTPRVSFDTPLPVVVYIGGSTLSGDTPEQLRPTATLARQQEVVFVQVHVRRSVLGFFASDVLSRASHPHTSGNYGLSDLVAALEWVNLNAEHFGGSPALVTLLGHQSGATLMSLLTTMPRTKYLYTHMWLTGGSGGLDNFTMPDLVQASDNNAQFLSYVSCTDARCLRNRTVTELLQAVPRVWHKIPTGLPRLNEPRHNWLVRDGYLVEESVWDAWSRPQRLRSSLPDPLLVLGVNAQQDGAADLFAVREWNVSSVAESYVHTTLGTFPGSLRSEATSQYLATAEDPWTQIATMVSDVRTVCPLHAAAKQAAKHFTNRVYFYVAAQKRHGPTGHIADALSDISAILGVYTPITPQESSFVENMQNMFYGFVRSGRLPLDASAAEKVYIIDDGIGTVDGRPNCHLWERCGLYPQYARRD